MLIINNLTKQYGKFTALDNLNLTVKEGSIFGFLGHNGAGKTTTISILTTLIHPTSGGAFIGGHDVVNNNLKVRDLIGYLPENVNLYGDLTAVENLRFFGKLSKIDNLEERITETLDLLGIQDYQHRKLRTYSKGMRQRIGIAQAILHRPKILFLDEPTSGLDPQGTKELMNILVLLNKKFNTTIFMNTHLLSEVVKVCTDIAIIKSGKLIISDSLENVLQQFPQEKSLEDIYFKLDNKDA